MQLHCMKLFQSFSAAVLFHAKNPQLHGLVASLNVSQAFLKDFFDSDLLILFSPFCISILCTCCTRIAVVNMEQIWGEDVLLREKWDEE